MKIIVTDDVIVSLENVRRVEMKSYSETHSKYGKKYTITNYRLDIDYNDNSSERIDCGEDAKGKAQMIEIFNKIVDILKND
jgi:hypothetical protein